MLVHITLNLTPAESELQAEAVQEALTRAGARQIDTRYLRRYALVSAEVDEAQIDGIRALEMVLDVEPDGPVGAL
ncbi:hypothetical protein [Deinococcus enclensis]|uniref:Uncharacterized protein n=1 Tax=Deinococcus enclensis TaxID=1049582 RepID=A0ABT9MG54_9DEIO|nr:hypothetical protein [Deinococcus enclensis]MDP9765572.1 hypothetical protein [Deinococcus enclensis]